MAIEGWWFDMRTAVIAITSKGALLGRRLRDGLAGGELHVSRRYAGQADRATRTFDPDDLKEVVTELWRGADGLVFIMATGIVVRMIAPLLKSKETDPAVVVMDDAGTFSISLLSGHLGGANELAGRCALISGARPVITTATDVNKLPSFDMLAKEQGWVIDNISGIKTLNRLMLDGERIAVLDHGGQTRDWFRGRANLCFFETFSEVLASGARGFLLVTNRHTPHQAQPDNLLILRPRNLVLGIGCNRNTSLDEIDEFVGAHLRRIFLSLKSVSRIATAAAKREEIGLLAFAERYDIPLCFYESEELNRVTVPSCPSPHAMAAIGANGVAEPAALLASEGGRLLLKKVKSANVTLAVAELTGGEHV